MRLLYSDSSAEETVASAASASGKLDRMGNFMFAFFARSNESDKGFYKARDNE